VTAAPVDLQLESNFVISAESWVITFDASLGNVSDIILTGDALFNRDATIPRTETVGVLPTANVPGVNEIQSLLNPRATAGTFTLTVNGQTTDPLNFDATPQEIEAALNALFPDLVTVTTNVRVDGFNTLYVDGQNPRIFFGEVEETEINLLQGQGSTLTLNNGRYVGKVFVQGGDQPETQPGDVFNVLTIAGQTFVRGGAGNDQFHVGEGTVGQINSELFLFGEAGVDSVFVHSEDLGTGADVAFNKRTVQHTLERNQLSKVTNALEFTITDPLENQKIGQQLELDSIEYAELAALASALDLEKVAIQGANELGANLGAALNAAKTEFLAGIATLISEQQDNLTTFVEGALTEYFNTRNGIATTTADIARIEQERAQKNAAISRLVTIIQQRAVNSFLAPLSGIVSFSVTQSVSTKQILEAYARNNSVLKNLPLVGVLKVFGVPANISTTIDVNVTSDIRTRIVDIQNLANESKLAQERLKELQLALPNTISRLQPYFINSSGVGSSLTNAQLNEFYNNALINGAQVAARTVTETNTGVQNVLTRIASEINSSATDTVNLLNNAIAEADALATATTALDTRIDDFLTDLGALQTDLGSAADASDPWDRWVRLVRLQIVSDAQLSQETSDAAAIKDLWLSIPDDAAFTLASDFAAKANPTWTEALELFNSTEFQSIIDAYKKAESIASEFTNYRLLEYQDFRSVFRNILRFETAQQFLDRGVDPTTGEQLGFDFETFKAAFQANIDELNAVVDLLDKVALEARLQAQLDSLNADKEVIDAVVARNDATVAFFSDLLTQANSDLVSIRTEVQDDYTLKIAGAISWLFGFSSPVNFLLPGWVNDVRYVAALQARADALADYDKAFQASKDAQADQLTLDNTIAAVSGQLGTIQGELSAATTDLDALRETLDQQYKFLRDLSVVAIEVLSETRVGEAAVGFENARSLISPASVRQARQLSRPPRNPAPSSPPRRFPTSSACCHSAA
jgi:hypothetical protein